MSKFREDAPPKARDVIGLILGEELETVSDFFLAYDRGVTTALKIKGAAILQLIHGMFFLFHSSSVFVQL